MKMKELLDSLFNWKKHPESIFPLMIPLAALATICQLAVAVLELITNNDPWYLVIVLVIMIPGGWSIYVLAKRTLTLVRENERRADKKAD
mgnify:CR=1 FL=1